MSKHIKFPIRISPVGSGFEVDDHSGWQVAQIAERPAKDNDERRAVAAFIVRACNNHARLVAVAESHAQLLRWLESQRALSKAEHAMAEHAAAALAAAKEPA